MIPLSVLTVDDEPHIHAGLDSLIDWSAYGCEHAGSALDGAEALEFIERERPDIIVTDIRMPGVDGLELIRRVREMSGYSPAIILVSGYDEFEYARTALRFGVQDYLLKPIDEDELGKLLVAVRDRPAGRSADRPAGRDRSEPHDPLVIRSVTRRLVISRPTADTVAAAGQLLAIADNERLFYIVVVPATAPPVMPATAPPAAPPIAQWSTTRLSDALRETVYRASADRVFQETGSALGCLLSLPDGPAAAGERDGGAMRVKGLHHRLTELAGQPLVVVAGTPVAGPSDAWQSRDSAHAILEARYLMAAPGCHHPAPGKPHGASDATCRIPGDPVGAIIGAVERLDGASADSVIDSVCNALGGGTTTSGALRNWLYALQAELNALVWELDGTVGDELGAIGRLSEHVSLRPVSEIRSVVATAVSATIAQIAELRRLGRHSVIRLVKRRVDRSFADQLSLADLADEFGMNAVYLGQMFKQVIGTSFKTYARKARIAEARRLLQSTNLRIPEVGAAVGYHDCDFFVEQFRRETDTTPAAYRTASARKDAKP